MFKNQISWVNVDCHTKLGRAHRRLFSSWVELNYQPPVRTSKSSAMRPSQPLHQSKKSKILKWFKWGINTCGQAKYFRQALTGFERPTSCLQNRRINHYATEPHMSSRTTQNFNTTNWQIIKDQHTSKHVRFRERKKFKVQIDQSADVYIFAPVRKTVALTSMIHKMQYFTRKEHLPLWHKGSDNNSLNIEQKINITNSH